MTDAARPWSWSAPPDTPRRRLRHAAVRDLVWLVPVLVAIVVVGAAMGPWAAAGVLIAVVGARAVFVARDGATRSMRRQGIEYVRLGRGGPPDRWRLAAYQLSPLVLTAAVVMSLAGSLVGPIVAWGLYVGLVVLGWRKASRYGSNLDPLLALAGLDVWWAGDPPTPSESSEPPPTS